VERLPSDPAHQALQPEARGVGPGSAPKRLGAFLFAALLGTPTNCQTGVLTGLGIGRVRRMRTSEPRACSVISQRGPDCPMSLAVSHPDPHMGLLCLWSSTGPRRGASATGAKTSRSPPPRLPFSKNHKFPIIGPFSFEYAWHCRPWS
jgi:hypothetical protein